MHVPRALGILLFISSIFFGGEGGGGAGTLGFRVLGLRFGCWALGFRALGFRASVVDFRVAGLLDS